MNRRTIALILPIVAIMGCAEHRSTPLEPEGPGEGPGAIWISTENGRTCVDSMGYVVSADRCQPAAKPLPPSFHSCLLVSHCAGLLPGPEPEPRMEMRVHYMDTADHLGPEHRAAIGRAVARWERILEPYEPRDVDFDSVRDFRGQYADWWDRSVAPVIGLSSLAIRAQGITGPILFVGREPPRSGVLASASPIWLDENGHPMLGVIAIGQEAVEPDQPWDFEDVVLHEIAHVLGMGSVDPWFDFIEAEDGRNFFQGPHAYLMFRDAGGDYKPAIAPDLHHWAENQLQTELMTPTIDGDGAVLSRITLGAFRDLGYGVRWEHADDYEVPAAAAKAPAGWGCGAHRLPPGFPHG